MKTLPSEEGIKKKKKRLNQRKMNETSRRRDENLQRKKYKLK